MERQTVQRRSLEEVMPAFIKTERLGSYELSSVFASGTLTSLSRARRVDVALEEDAPRYAIKRLLTRHLGDLALRSLFLDAGRLGLRLASPHLVRTFEVVEGAEPYWVIEHIEGRSLSSLLAGPRPEVRVLLPVILDVLEGLEALHHCAPGGWVHGAPCARHIVVGSDGVGRLYDWTHAIGPELPWSARRDERLRPSEMAPEQALGPAHVDARCDLFIVGALLWQVLTGRTLFGGAEARDLALPAREPAREQSEDAEALRNMLRMSIPTPSEAGSEAGRGIDEICRRALSRARGERFASAREMCAALREEALRAGCLAGREEIARWLERSRSGLPESGTTRLGGLAEPVSVARGPARFDIDRADRTSPGSARAEPGVAGEGTGARKVFRPARPRGNGASSLPPPPALPRELSFFGSRADPHASTPPPLATGATGRRQSVPLVAPELPDEQTPSALVRRPELPPQLPVLLGRGPVPFDPPPSSAASLSEPVLPALQPSSATSLEAQRDTLRPPAPRRWPVTRESALLAALGALCAVCALVIVSDSQSDSQHALQSSGSPVAEATLAAPATPHRQTPSAPPPAITHAPPAISTLEAFARVERAPSSVPPDPPERVPAAVEARGALREQNVQTRSSARQPVKQQAAQARPSRAQPAAPVAEVQPPLSSAPLAAPAGRPVVTAVPHATVMQAQPVQAIPGPGAGPYAQRPATFAETTPKAQPPAARPAWLPPLSREESPPPDKRKVKRGEQIDALPRNPY
jgi:hypothetical protein